MNCDKSSGDGDGCYTRPKYLTDYNNMKQDTSTWCALNVVQQTFYELFGVIVSEQKLYKYGYTGSSGTGPAEIKAIITRLACELRFKVKIKTYSKKDISRTEIGKKVASPISTVFFHELYKDQWGHWDYCVSVCTINIYMANSLKGKVIGYPRATMESWFNGISSDDSIYILTKM